MVTPIQTFPCPFCGRRMGVRTEMLGRRVKCPHCSQVVLAPAAGPAPAEPLPTPPAPARAPARSPRPVNFTAPTPPAVPAPLPPSAETAGGEPTHPGDSQFIFDQKREAPDSILSEGSESEDEVFSSQTGGKLPRPIVPDAEPNAIPRPGAPEPAAPAISSSHIPTLELRGPPEIVAPPVSASALLPAPPPEPAPPVDPFAFDTMASPAVMAVEPLPTPFGPETALVPTTVQRSSDEETKETLVRKGRQRPPATAGAGPRKTTVYALGAYAILMTVLAVYGLFFRSPGKLDPGHPLSSIPDTFGEFDPATRKKVGQLKVDLDAPLPGDLRAGLGGSIEVGQLRVQPFEVEKRPLKIVTEGKAAGDVARRQSRADALVLRLRVTNTSDGVPVFPLDPAFTRAARADDRPATRLVIGRRTLYGGAIPWPFGGGVKREFEEAQAGDYEPLGPGQTRDYVVFTNEDAGLAPAVRAADTLLWKVQVRRGFVEYRGKDVPVTAIIGVEFTAAQVKNLN